MAPTVVRVERSALLDSRVSRELASEFVPAVKAFAAMCASTCRPTTTTAVHAVQLVLGVVLAKVVRVHVPQASRSAMVLVLIS